jgi:hypothetical protein
VVEMRRSDEPGETSLAKAAAAIVTAHWRGGGRSSTPRHERPAEPDHPMNGNGFAASQRLFEPVEVPSFDRFDTDPALPTIGGMAPPISPVPVPAPALPPFPPVPAPALHEVPIPVSPPRPMSPPSGPMPAGPPMPPRSAAPPMPAGSPMRPPRPSAEVPMPAAPPMPAPATPPFPPVPAPALHEVPIPVSPPMPAAPPIPRAAPPMAPPMPAAPPPVAASAPPPPPPVLASPPPPPPPLATAVATAPVARPYDEPPAASAIPTQRRPVGRDEPVDFGFADSVMSDVAFPEPVLSEAVLHDPYAPGPGLVNGRAEARRDSHRDHLDTDTEPMLPQRVPGMPDVPEVPLPPNDPLRDPDTAPVADGAELTRIAARLRDVTGDATERPDGFDLEAVLEAVRGVVGVRDANLRWNTGYGHTLRIEFDETAEEGQVTRQVARLLREKMGLAAQPSTSRLTSDETTLDRPTRTVPRPAPAPTPPVATRPRPAPAPEAPPEQRADLAARGTRPLPPPGRDETAARLVLDHVQVTTLGVDATVLVRLDLSSGGSAVGKGHGPAVDQYLLRLAACAAGDAVDQLLLDPTTGDSRARCFIEHVGVVPFAGCEVAVVVLLFVCGAFAEELAGCALINGDPRQAVVRATLSAVNRRLESLLAS